MWQLGDVAMAKICMKVYAKVRIVKDEYGLYEETKVLAFSPLQHKKEYIINKCYHIEIIRTGACLWIPQHCLKLAERSRPFYGVSKKSVVKKTSITRKNQQQRKQYIDHIVPHTLTKRPNLINPDLNTTYDSRHIPKLEGKYENAFKEFVRLGQELLFDEWLPNLLKCYNFNHLMCMKSEDIFEIIYDKFVNQKEIEYHLYQCWRYLTVYRENSESSHSPSSSSSPHDGSMTCSPPDRRVHITWCIVCGNTNNLSKCTKCPTAYHLACKDNWLFSILHRKKVPSTFCKPTKTRSKTRNDDTENRCPCCYWGPDIGYGDIVWHKLGTCPWWPAKVLTPGALPSCLVTGRHNVTQWPLQYYGTLNYAWCDVSRLSLFLPTHEVSININSSEELHDAVQNASDDYIATYLT